MDSQYYNVTRDGPKVGGLTEFGKVGYTSAYIYCNVPYYIMHNNVKTKMSFAIKNNSFETHNNMCELSRLYAIHIAGDSGDEPTGHAR